MVRNRREANIRIYKAHQILEKCNYIISYDNEFVNQATLNINLNEEKNVKFQWLADKGKLISTAGHNIACPEYAASCILKAIIKEICASNKYPFFFINFKKNGNPVDNLHFATYNEDKDKTESLDIIIEDIMSNGLLPEHIELAKDSDVMDGLEKFLSYKFGLTLDTRRND